MSHSSFALSTLILFCLLPSPCAAAKRRPPPGGRVAVVVDERLSALRETPELSGKLLQRVRRGRFVAIRRETRNVNGVIFYRVNLSSRTSGWIQRNAVAIASQRKDEERLLQLIRASEDYDRIARAKIFLDLFPQSPLRPAVLLLYGDEAEAAAVKLSQEAARRLSPLQQNADAPAFSYFLNYAGLDRYNRQGITFSFDDSGRRFHYTGRAWREIIKRYPRSGEASEARKRMAAKPLAREKKV